jgi:DNA polymerase-1
MEKTLLVIDFNNLCHRIFHGYGENVLTAPDGRVVTVVHGLLSMTFSLAAYCGATHVASAFESRTKTHRAERYTEYKAGRAVLDPSLREQMEMANIGVGRLGFARYRADRYEADDTLAALSVTAIREGFAHVYLATGDKDLMGAVDDKVTVLWIAKGLSELREHTYVPAKVEARFGIKPAQFPDFRALMGDHSDNIPGAPGIGEKGAKELIIEFGSIDGIYANLDAVKKPSVRAILRDNEELIRLSLELSQLHPEATLTPPFDPDAGELGHDERGKTLAWLNTYGLRSVIGRLPPVSA